MTTLTEIIQSHPEASPVEALAMAQAQGLAPSMATIYVARARLRAQGLELATRAPRPGSIAYEVSLARALHPGWTREEIARDLDLSRDQVRAALRRLRDARQIAAGGAP